MVEPTLDTQLHILPLRKALRSPGIPRIKDFSSAIERKRENRKSCLKGSLPLDCQPKTIPHSLSLPNFLL